jgi:hypothetical protein
VFPDPDFVPNGAGEKSPLRKKYLATVPAANKMIQEAYLDPGLALIVSESFADSREGLQERGGVPGVLGGGGRPGGRPARNGGIGKNRGGSNLEKIRKGRKRKGEEGTRIWSYGIRVGTPE